MAYRRRILPRAESELKEIVSYLCEVLGSPGAARSFLDDFMGQVDALCEHPFMRPLSHLPELAALGYRSAPVGNYLFLYRVTDDWVVVAHVFHQSQDYARLV